MVNDYEEQAHHYANLLSGSIELQQEARLLAKSVSSRDFKMAEAHAKNVLLTVKRVKKELKARQHKLS